MKKYNYYEAVAADVMDYIRENIDFASFDDLDELSQHLNVALWACDSVTGNASGSYFCNAWTAEEALCHNMDLLAEACAEFCDDMSRWAEDPEGADAVIRCYLLGGAISDALEEIADEFEAAHELEEIPLF